MIYKVWIINLVISSINYDFLFKIKYEEVNDNRLKKSAIFTKCINNSALR